MWDIVFAVRSALAWLAVNGPGGCSNAPEDAPPLFLVGDSSGGGSSLSAALSLKATEWKLLLNNVTVPMPVETHLEWPQQQQVTMGATAQLSGVVMFSPWTNLACNTPDYFIMFSDQYLKVILEAGPVKNEKDFAWNAKQYLGSKDKKLLRDPNVSAYWADKASFEGAPPLFFAVGGSETTILGDSVVVAERAAAAGVPVELEIYEGMWHDFPMYSEGCGNPWKRQLWQGVDAIARAAAFMKHFAGESPQRGAAEAQQNGGTQQLAGLQQCKIGGLQRSHAITRD
eukprot:CAMPEP_0178461724 /NCGR_PEP_ID=MMETSP0689_2-20121128/49460_1 /TAXON_ID=160604 /ORGANISM="Amphidinium massartii, Strain CS-259" /LENGTH=284 /DNA_ID=CAMNT_0020088575 /DNA_START=279 /DNA_END=1135 /DNA_ORIENTATION=+